MDTANLKQKTVQMAWSWLKWENLRKKLLIY